MASLHLWFSKLKWSMDVLLRFYERHAFICALHKETRLLFDELIFCLQRLYSIPFRMEMPFSDDLLEQVPIGSAATAAAVQHHAHQAIAAGMQMMHRSGCSSCCTSGNATTLASTPDDDDYSSRTFSSRSKSAGKSMIPRPISLPKRLEAKLGKSPSPVRSAKIKGQLMPVPSAAPTKASARKSRVRDTIKLFDSQSGPSASATANVTRRVPSSKRSSSRPQSGCPKSGAGEAMVTPPDGNSIGSCAAGGGRAT
jgi:hypothetical protein